MLHNGFGIVKAHIGKPQVHIVEHGIPGPLLFCIIHVKVAIGCPMFCGLYGREIHTVDLGIWIFLGCETLVQSCRMKAIFWASCTELNSPNTCASTDIHHIGRSLHGRQGQFVTGHDAKHGMLEVEAVLLFLHMVNSLWLAGDHKREQETVLRRRNVLESRNCEGTTYSIVRKPVGPFLVSMVVPFILG